MTQSDIKHLKKCVDCGGLVTEAHETHFGHAECARLQAWLKNKPLTIDCFVPDFVPDEDRYFHR